MVMAKPFVLDFRSRQLRSTESFPGALQGRLEESLVASSRTKGSGQRPSSPVATVWLGTPHWSHLRLAKTKTGTLEWWPAMPRTYRRISSQGPIGSVGGEAKKRASIGIFRVSNCSFSMVKHTRDSFRMGVAVRASHSRRRYEATPSLSRVVLEEVAGIVRSPTRVRDGDW